MSFMSPKVPTPPTAPNTPVAADAGTIESMNNSRGLASLISTGSAGLRRKANTQKTSLVGGA